MEEKTTIAREAPAKINLFLRVLERRPDHYHRIETTMLKLALADEVTMELTDSPELSIAVPGYPELANQDFPAWSLLEQPALASRLADEDCLSEVEVPEDYLVTADLVMAGACAVPAADLIESRKRLQQLSPILFVHYLERYGRV